MFYWSALQRMSVALVLLTFLWLLTFWAMENLH